MVGAFTLELLVAGECIHLLPAATALTGATVLLFLVRPDIEEMIGAVDWTTLITDCVCKSMANLSDFLPLVTFVPA